ncbi:MAG: hypothetical protein FJX29_12370, partial [Alphaproteobacteria bacterium]|nr:hypothetical protein [Alphaproteobacteria bacterium]
MNSLSASRAPLDGLIKTLGGGRAAQLARTPEGFDAFAAADLARALANSGLQARASHGATLVHVARDGARSRSFAEALS